MKAVIPNILYGVAMIIVVVSADVLFWQHQIEWRLIGNISIVALFAIGYFAIFGRKRKS